MFDYAKRNNYGITHSQTPRSGAADKSQDFPDSMTLCESVSVRFCRFRCSVSSLFATFLSKRKGTADRWPANGKKERGGNAMEAAALLQTDSRARTHFLFTLERSECRSSVDLPACSGALRSLIPISARKRFPFIFTHSFCLHNNAFVLPRPLPLAQTSRGPADRSFRRADGQQHHDLERRHLRAARHAVRGRHIQINHRIHRRISKQTANSSICVENVPSECVRRRRHLLGHLAESVESNVRRVSHFDFNTGKPSAHSIPKSALNQYPSLDSRC